MRNRYESVIIGSGGLAVYSVAAVVRYLLKCCLTLMVKLVGSCSLFNNLTRRFMKATPVAQTNSRKGVKKHFATKLHEPKIFDQNYDQLPVKLIYRHLKLASSPRW